MCSFTNASQSEVEITSKFDKTHWRPRLTDNAKAVYAIGSDNDTCWALVDGRQSLVLLKKVFDNGATPLLWMSFTWMPMGILPGGITARSDLQRA